MKSILRILAGLVVLTAALFWVATGANRGWTKTSVPIKTTDEVTGIEGVAFEKKCVPGLDFLGVALLGAAVLTGASVFASNKKPHAND
jgi:hypothetical protein